MTQIETKKYKINVIDSSELASIVTPDEIEMDKRARAAVKAAINKAKKCKQPIARYDMRSKSAFVESADGEKRYVK